MKIVARVFELSPGVFPNPVCQHKEGGLKSADVDGQTLQTLMKNCLGSACVEDDALLEEFIVVLWPFLSSLP